MSKTAKLLTRIVFSLTLITLAAAANAATKTSKSCAFMPMVKHSSCVQTMDKACPPMHWNESFSVIDYGDGTMMVTFVYEPKCLRAPIPCRIASRIAAVMVDCNTHTATCQ